MGSPPVEAGVDITIYLPRLFADGSLGLSGVRRRLPPTGELARGALRALIDGPSGPERAADYQYPLHPRTRVVSFRVERGIASTELDDAVSPVRGRPFSELVYWSIVYTLTEVPDVQRVTLLRQAQPLGEFGYPPISIREAAGRADAPQWAQPR